MNRHEIAGAVAVVTGGAGGIGSALSAALTNAGARVAVVDLRAPAAEAAASRLPGAVGLAADVGDEQSVRAMIETVEATLGPIGIYCSNAGVAPTVGLGTSEEWDTNWRVHVLAHVHAARLVVPRMTSQGSGTFVVTASAAGLLSMTRSATYTASKHAAVAFAEWLAIANGDDGLRVHCICPLGVRTPMVSADRTSEAEAERSGAILEPEAVAEAALDAIRTGRFLVLPHPEVQGYESAKVADRDRWIAGMRRLRTRAAASTED